MTKEQYEALSRPFRGRPMAVKGLKVANRCLTLSCYLLYPSLLLWALVTGDPRLLRLVLVPAVSFGVVSVFRRLRNSPRPYEALDIVPLIPRNKHGECSATSFLRNWDSILEKKRANLRSISEPARLRQPPPRSTGAAHARGRAQSIREERRIAAPPVLFALLWVRLLPALYGPFCGPLRPFGGCPWGVTPPARECLPPAPPDTRRRG